MKKALVILVLVGIFGWCSGTANAQQAFKVVLDAGHGGTDPGNVGAPKNKYLEKDIVLGITLKVGKLLEKEKDVEVIYTRKDDSFIGLKERGELAHKSEANIFVSIHCDAFTSPYAFGAGTFVLGQRGNAGNFRIAQKENSAIFLEDNYEEKYQGFDPNSPESTIGITLMQEEFLDESLLIASMIQERFAKGLKRKDRLVKQDNFQVLRETFMPSVLVETGFLTNPKEGAYLNSEKGQKEIAKAIYDGIMAYKRQFDANTVVDVKPVVEQPIVKEAKPRVFKGVDFKVQIASSTKRVSTESYNFKGLKGVERIRIGAHHKYYYGKTSDYAEVKMAQKLAKEKGYIGAFVVAFKSGKKISVLDVLKTEQK